VSTGAKSRSLLNRRSFLGGSLSATVASLALPANVQSFATESHAPHPDTSAKREIVFRSAKPIWPQGRDKEMNLFVGFRAVFEAPREGKVQLSVAGATLYRIYLNGRFFGWGPARGPHDYFRFDTWDITPLLGEGGNLVCIEVASYNINSYYVLNQPSFLQAEVATNSSVLASTGGAGSQFQATILSERVQKVQRYSFQRAFSEVYRLDSRLGDWRENVNAKVSSAECSSSAPRNLIERRVPHPAYELRQPEQVCSSGTFRWGANGPNRLAEDHSVPFGAKISDHLLGYPEQKMTVIPYLELQKTETVTNSRIDEAYVWHRPIELGTSDFRVFDFGANLTGFFGARVTVRAPTRLYFTFDETLTNGDVDFTRLMCVNIVAYTLAPGTYNLESFEPYVLRFLKPMVLEGKCEIDQVYLREYTTPDVWTATFHSSDEGLNELFDAGRETYRPNTVDFFTDTPSRERAGWLCDSSFTAQVSPLLSGHTNVEKCFFENFLLPERFANIPDGMIPMCYPADHYDGGFVPTWALWFLVQLEQYLLRSGDRELVDALRPRVIKLLDYFRPFHNEDGLLEKLKGLVFIEWSKSNDYVQDVSYPANMLYAAALEAVGSMFNLPQRIEQAEALRRVIRSQSYDGEFFVDNAVRQEGKLVATRNRTETCQYYAFYFATATAATHSDLWKKLSTQFGPKRRITRAYPEIAPSNAFMGNVMRIELLSRSGLTDQLVEESKLFFLPMAELTGTFWENMGNEASMNHAFGSHVIVHLFRDVLGLYRIDSVNKLVEVRFSDSSIPMCEGRVPTPDGFVFLKWKKTSGTLTYQVDAPAGYSVQVKNQGAFNAVPRRFPRGKIEYGYKVEGGYK
jgi:alpha-L-rhamnosidase